MDRCTKNLAESERGWGGLDLWEEQSPIDKKLLFFKGGRARLTNLGNVTFNL